MNNSGIEFDDNEMSALRFLLSTATGTQFMPIKNLEIAKETENAYLVMEGDAGGEIYLSCPVRLIKCSEQHIKELLVFLDRRSWDDLENAGSYYEILRPHSGIPGGLGGGYAGTDLWINEEFVSDGLEEYIKSVLFHADED